MKENEQPPSSGYQHTEEDYIQDYLEQGNNIDDFIQESDLEFPICLEIKKGCCWERIESTGKFYRISKELYYLHGQTTYKQDLYKGEDKESLEVQEMYSLIFGNISRRDTLSSLHFYTRQKSRVAHRIISEAEFEKKLEMISKDFEDFISKKYKPLKIDSNEKLRVKQENDGNDDTPF